MPTRKMPQNKEAEMSVLGAAFLSKEALNKICEEMDEDMFYDEANQKLYRAIKSLYLAHTPLDITTIKEELDKQKDLTNVGGLEYISDVIDSVATTANIDYYIKIVKEKSVLRNLIDTATNIITDSYEDKEDISYLLDEAEKKILSVAKNRESSDLSPIKDVLKRAQELLDERSSNKSEITGIPSGFYKLDKAIHGFHEGELIILAARPGMGKTAFALNIATNAAMRTNKAIAVFNLEMPAESLVDRMISAVGGIDSSKIQVGMMNQNDWKRYNEARSQLENTNIYIEDNMTITAAEIRAKCRRLTQKKEGLGLVIIDYLQLITSGGRRPDSRQQEVSEISRSLKTLAMELKVPVIALAQLSRNTEKRENNEPMLTDLRESGSIEQDADLVIFINRPDYYKTKEELDKQENVLADIIIAKHRKGATGKFKALFELKKMNFRNYLETEGENHE